MGYTEINCPRCNSLQEFKPKYVKLDSGDFEKYIRCGKCHYRRVLAILSYQDMRMLRKEQTRRKR